MNYNNDLPRSVGWFTRFLGYGVGGVIIVGLMVYIGQARIVKSTMQCTEEPAFFSGKSSALDRTKALLACLERRNSFLANFLIRSPRRILRELNAPCLHVGVWRSSRPGCTYSVTLKDDGSFSSKPENCAISADFFSGSWGVSSNKMIWMYDNGRVWPPDVNKIETATNDFFTLIEENGSRTTFHRLGNAIGGQCGGDSSASQASADVPTASSEPVRSEASAYVTSQLSEPEMAGANGVSLSDDPQSFAGCYQIGDSVSAGKAANRLKVKANGNGEFSLSGIDEKPTGKEIPLKTATPEEIGRVSEAFNLSITNGISMKWIEGTPNQKPIGFYRGTDGQGRAFMFAFFFMENGMAKRIACP